MVMMNADSLGGNLVYVLATAFHPDSSAGMLKTFLALLIVCSLAKIVRLCFVTWLGKVRLKRTLARLRATKEAAEKIHHQEP
jgi:hypothetical protein